MQTEHLIDRNDGYASPEIEELDIILSYAACIGFSGVDSDTYIESDYEF